MRDQRQRVITHKPGDLLWRDGVGWAVCLEQTPERTNQQISARLKCVEMVVMAGLYVNASEVCCRNLVLAGLIEELRSIDATPILAAKPTLGLS